MKEDNSKGLSEEGLETKGMYSPLKLRDLFTASDQQIKQIIVDTDRKLTIEG